MKDIRTGMDDEASVEYLNDIGDGRPGIFLRYEGPGERCCIPFSFNDLLWLHEAVQEATVLARMQQEGRFAPARPSGEG